MFNVPPFASTPRILLPPVMFNTPVLPSGKFNWDTLPLKFIVPPLIEKLPATSPGPSVIVDIPPDISKVELNMTRFAKSSPLVIVKSLMLTFSKLTVPPATITFPSISRSFTFKHPPFLTSKRTLYKLISSPPSEQMVTYPSIFMFDIL